jgi:threonylcarbamoyladenosine tRNA methylthiotransferase MtaB
MSDTPAAQPLIVTFGCRLNAFESEIVRAHVEKSGQHDVIVVNTCAVTGEAVRQARQAIRRLRRDHPARPIVVTGCAAQLHPQEFAAMPEVTRVIGNREKLASDAITDKGNGTIAVADIMTVREPASHGVEGFEGRARAYLQVQQGCDHRCTFCIIPYARGPHRSLPAETVIAGARRLVAAGYREVVLTGVDICSWGREIVGQPALGRLVRRVLAEVPDLQRLRLSTLDPAAVDDELFQALAEDDRLMGHWHLSLQALDDLILKRMRRRHDRAAVFALAERARRARPDIVFGADVIAGFPTESDEMFTTTEDGLRGLGVVWLHVFPYSPRPGTPAARMPQVPPAVRRARAQRLRSLGETARAQHLAAHVGRRLDVLVEAPDRGRARDYSPIHLTQPAAPGSIITVRIAAATAEYLQGEPQ